MCLALIIDVFISINLALTKLASIATCMCCINVCILNCISDLRVLLCTMFEWTIIYGYSMEDDTQLVWTQKGLLYRLLYTTTSEVQHWVTLFHIRCHAVYEYVLITHSSSSHYIELLPLWVLKWWKSEHQCLKASSDMFVLSCPT